MASEDSKDTTPCFISDNDAIKALNPSSNSSTNLAGKCPKIDSRLINNVALTDDNKRADTSIFQPNDADAVENAVRFSPGDGLKVKGAYGEVKNTESASL